MTDFSRYLDYKSKDSFIKEVIIPYFIGSVDKNIGSVIFDIDGKIIIATNLYAQSIGYSSWKDIIGKTFRDIYFAPNEFYEIHEEIRKLVINLESTINYIMFVTIHDICRCLKVYHFPIFYPDGTVVASRTVIAKMDILPPSILMEKMLGKQIGEKHRLKIADLSSITLSVRQHEILFLLTHGFSQEEIANILDISRGSVARTLNRQISSKFGLEGSFSSLIKYIAYELGFAAKIPETFSIPRIIRLSDNVNIL